MKYKITIVALNFYPEDTAIGLYTTQLAEYLSQNHFEVQVITGFPYYPQWKTKEEYRNKPKRFIENHQGIKIIRYKQYVPQNPTFFKRILHLLDFTLGTWLNASKIKDSDLVFTVVPFTTSILVGNKIARKTKAKHWVHIQDFEFDAAAETNLIGHKKFIFQILFWIERKLLLKPHALSTISRAMHQKLKQKTQNKKPLFLLPNWVDIHFINPQKAQTHPYLQSGKFKILYAGNIGEKQDWNLFLEVARNINDPEIEFVIVGSGAKESWLKNQIRNMPHVKLHAPVPYQELPDLLCSADLHILFQKNNVIDTVMPSKILGMMASGKPSLITGNPKSEVAAVFKESQAGIYLNAPTYKQVIHAIRQIKQQPSIYGSTARHYVAEHFSAEKILRKFKHHFESLLKKPT